MALSVLEEEIVLYLADLDPLEVTAKIVVFHPEQAIVGFREPNCSLDLRCPLIRVVTPAPVPFEVTPRIAELNEDDLFSVLIITLRLELDQFYCHQRVSMRSD